jgi:hypothetical protein
LSDTFPVSITKRRNERINLIIHYVHGHNSRKAAWMLMAHILLQVGGMSFYPEFEYPPEIDGVILRIADASRNVAIAHREENICYASQVPFTPVGIEFAQCIEAARAS